MGWPPSRGSTSRRPTRFTLRLSTLACTGSASIAATGRSRATSKKAAPSRPRASSPTAASSSRRDLAWSLWTSSAPAGSVPGTPFLFVDGRPPLLAASYRLTLRPACSLTVSLAERPRHLAPPKPDLLPATSGRYQRPQVVRRDPLPHERAGRDWRRRRPRVVQAPEEEVRLLQKHCCRSLEGSLKLTLLLCFRQRARPRRPSEATPHQPARCQRLLCALDLALCRFCPGGCRRPLLAQGHRSARHRLIGPLAHARSLRRPDTAARRLDPAGLSRRGRRRVDRF
jgi:hypothetical protein